MINLLGSDYIVSNHNLDETWELVVKAITECSREQFFWNIVEDRNGSRITAVMEYQKALRLKRRLLLEINFYPAEDNHVRLELRYTISPMLNIVEPEALLTNTADTIARAVGTEFITADDVAPPAVPVKGQTGLLTGIEIILGINLFAIIVGAGTGNGPAVVSALLGIQVALILPVAVIYWLFKSFSRPDQSAGRRVMVGVASVICGILICIIAAPIILFGLCIGAFMVMSGSR